jgi:hypothetical protein
MGSKGCGSHALNNIRTGETFPSGTTSSLRFTVFVAGERLLECPGDRQGRVAGHLAIMQTTVRYKRVD